MSGMRPAVGKLATMRNFVIFYIATLAVYPSISQAQVDPDWSRRELERMQVQQDRWDAQVARQRAELERMQAQQERQAARFARERAEREHGATPSSGRETSTSAAANPMSAGEMNWLLPITPEKLDEIFGAAQRVCPVSMGPVPLNPDALADATNHVSFNETAMFLYFCMMYIQGFGAGENATRAKQ